MLRESFTEYIPCHGAPSKLATRQDFIPEDCTFVRRSSTGSAKLSRRSLMKIGCAAAGATCLPHFSRVAEAAPVAPLMFYGVSAIAGVAAREAAKEFSRAVFTPLLEDFFDATVRPFFKEARGIALTKLESFLATIDEILKAIRDVIKAAARAVASWLTGEEAAPARLTTHERFRDQVDLFKGKTLAVCESGACKDAFLGFEKRARPYDINALENLSFSRLQRQKRSRVLPITERVQKNSWEQYEKEFQEMNALYINTKAGDEPIERSEILGVSTATTFDGEKHTLFTIDRADPDPALVRNEFFSVDKMVLPVPIRKKR